MSGVNLDGRSLRKGATDAIVNFVKEQGGQVPGDFMGISDRISRAGGTPLAVADGSRMLGVVHLKDIVEGRNEKPALATPRHGHPVRDDHR